MEEVPAETQFSSDPAARVRDIENSQKLLKDRILLIGQTLVEEREKSFDEIQQMKKTLIKLEEETERMRSFIQRLTEKTDTLARKEELMILQRQFDLFRK